LAANGANEHVFRLLRRRGWARLIGSTRPVRFAGSNPCQANPGSFRAPNGSVPVPNAHRCAG